MASMDHQPPPKRAKVEEEAVEEALAVRQDSRGVKANNKCPRGRYTIVPDVAAAIVKLKVKQVLRNLGRKPLRSDLSNLSDLKQAE